MLSEFSVEEENLQGQEDDFLNMDVEVETDDEGGAEVTYIDYDTNTHCSASCKTKAPTRRFFSRPI